GICPVSLLLLKLSTLSLVSLEIDEGIVPERLLLFSVISVISPLVTTIPYQPSIVAAVVPRSQLPSLGHPVFVVHELPDVLFQRSCRASNSSASLTAFCENTGSAKRLNNIIDKSFFISDGSYSGHLEIIHLGLAFKGNLHADRNNPTGFRKL